MNGKNIIYNIKLIIIGICKNIINEFITLYLTFKNIIKICKTIYYYRNYILMFNYKKLFLIIIKEIIRRIKKDIEIKLKTVLPFIKNFLYKYILNFSYYELCINYICDFDYTNFKLHILNKLDIYMILKCKIKNTINLIYLIIIYIIESNKKDFDDFEFLLNNITIISNSDFYTILNKIKCIIEVEIIKLKPLKEELEFFINIFYRNYNKYILL